jgi:hypothetical protein
MQTQDQKSVKLLASLEMAPFSMYYMLEHLPLEESGLTPTRWFPNRDVIEMLLLFDKNID